MAVFVLLSFLLSIVSVPTAPLAVAMLPIFTNQTIANVDGSLLRNNITYTLTILTDDLLQGFVFGFVRPSPSSPGFYLSIYFQIDLKDSITVVWTANRNRPVGMGATFEFAVGRGFMLRDTDGTIAWSALHSSAFGFEFQASIGNMRLLDPRNLTLWQSFDHPTDTLLQGADFDVGTRLVSSASTIDLSEGPFSLVAEPSGWILYASLPDPQPYWIWGFYGVNDTQSVLHACKNLSEARLISPAESSYSGLIHISLTSTIAPPSLISSALCKLNVLPSDVEFFTAGQNLTRFLQLDSNGYLRVNTWNGAWITDFDFLQGDPCMLPNYCGPYGICSNGGQCSCPQDTTGLGDNFEMVNSTSPSLGCKPPLDVTCKDAGANQHFVPLQTGAAYFPNQFLPSHTNSTIDDCKISCLYNCSCQAAFFDNSSSSCFLVKDLQTVRLTSDHNLLAFIKAHNILTSEKKKSVSTVLIAILIIVISATVFLVCLVIFRRRRRHQDTEAEEDEATFLETLPGLPPRYSYKELEVATDKFRRILGRGGFGTVYKGILPMKSENGRRNLVEVAVKKLESSRQGSREFRAEVATIGSINHLNLVRLLGFCAQRSYRLLVYEFMVNGSLDRWLFDRRQDDAILDWDARFRIAVGTARGIEYLHTQCRELIIHRDIKPHNILLDSHFNPKLSDFGLSRLLDRDQTSVLTAAKGTPAYLAPECWENPSVTEKSDVYSFGLVLLEIVGGRRNWDESFHSSKSYFPKWACEKYFDGRVMELVDETLNCRYDEQQVSNMVGIALLCIQKNAELRPSMRNVVQMLEGFMEIPSPPPQPPPHSSTGHNDPSSMLFQYGTEMKTSILLDSKFLSAPR